MISIRDMDCQGPTRHRQVERHLVLPSHQAAQSCSSLKISWPLHFINWLDEKNVNTEEVRNGRVYTDSHVLEPHTFSRMSLNWELQRKYYGDNYRDYSGNYGDLVVVQTSEKVFVLETTSGDYGNPYGTTAITTGLRQHLRWHSTTRFPNQGFVGGCWT